MSKIGEIYDKSSDWQQARWLELWALVNRHVDRTKPRSALDLGCGSGTRTQDLLRIFPQLQSLTAIDAEASMIRVAGQEHSDWRIKYEVLPIERLGKLQISKCDLFVANFSLHWVEAKEHLFEEMNCRAASGAVFLIGTCSRLPGLLREIDWFLRREWGLVEKSPFFYWDLGQWKSALKGFGWEIFAAQENSEPHLIVRPDDFLTEWHAASAGRAFYARNPSLLRTEQLVKLRAQLDANYRQVDGAWLFHEDTLLIGARRRD